MKRTAAIVGLLAALAALSWFFPLFHIVPLGQKPADQSQAKFDAATFAESFWNDRLLQSRDQAANAAIVLAVLCENPQRTREQFGRSVGVSRTTSYYFRGSGTVVAVEKNGVNIAVGSGNKPDLILRTGPLFGNTVRDATGLLDAGTFANSQQFNEISTELNRIVESQVLPNLKEGAKIGRTIEFVACAEVASDRDGNQPLAAVPLQVSFP